MAVKSITLVRHGTSTWSASGQHTSLTDIGLTAQGEQEAHALRDILNLRHYDMVYSSTLRRAHDTAKLAGFPDAQLDDDLCEWRYGQYEGKTTKEIQVNDPNWNIFRSGAPGGETPDDVGQRCDRLLTKWHYSGHTHILTPQSPAEAAAWLQSPHPLAALMHFETIVGPALRSGSYRHLPKAKPTAKTAKELKMNLEMMNVLGFEGTPAMLYRLKSGQLGRIPGMISEKQLTGLLPRLQ